MSYPLLFEEQGTMYNMINQISQCLAKIENYKDNIVLLIGKTGSGKSTLFNLLLKGKFLYRKDIDAVELDCKDPKFSEVKQGTTSVTKMPKLYFDDDSKHLLIDFPGFEDTSGEDLLTEAVINSIIVNFKVKIFYIVENYSNSLPNRGTDLQNHLKEIFKGNNSNQIQDSIQFVFNKYNDNNKDLLYKNIDNNFKKFNWKSKYLIIDKVKNEEGIEKFNYLNYQLWNAIIKTPSQKINQMFNFNNTYKLVDFLNIGEEYYFENVLNYIDQSLTYTLTRTQLSAIIFCVEQMKNDFFSQNISDLSQQSFNNYQNIIEGILQNLKQAEIEKFIDKQFKLEIPDINKIQEFGTIFLFCRGFKENLNNNQKCMKKFQTFLQKCEQIINVCKKLKRGQFKKAVIIGGIITGYFIYQYYPKLQITNQQGIYNSQSVLPLYFGRFYSHYFQNLNGASNNIGLT